MAQTDQLKEESAQLEQWESVQKSNEETEEMIPSALKPGAVAYISAVQVLIGLAYAMLGIMFFHTYLIFLLYGAGLILLGFGLLKGRRSAWRMEIAWLGICIIISVAELLRGKGVNLINLGVSGFLLLYFTTSNVRNKFVP